jgi:hypothetical protein
VLSGDKLAGYVPTVVTAVVCNNGEVWETGTTPKMFYAIESQARQMSGEVL